MSGSAPEKSARIEELKDAGRRLSTATILFHQAVADRLGLHPTDHKCIGLLAEGGPMTAGELAETTGLSTGAITGVIDRLEAAGFVRREDDPDDRRRVIIRVIPKRLGDVARLFEPFGAAMAELGSRYTEAELVTILDFLTRSCQLLREGASDLRRQAPAPPAKRASAAGGRPKGARRE